MKLQKQIVISLLESILNNVKSDTCNLDEQATTQLIDALTAMNKNVYNITKRAACDKILHCSTSTFELYRTMKLIPDGHHDYGSKELRWCENDFKDAIKYRNAKQNENITEIVK